MASGLYLEKVCGQGQRIGSYIFCLQEIKAKEDQVAEDLRNTAWV